MSLRSALILVVMLGQTLTGRADPTPERNDRDGDPLPEGALARFGTARFRGGRFRAGVTLSPDGKLLVTGSAALPFNKALEQAGAAVRPALIAALKTTPDLEKKRRLEELIRILSSGGPDPQHARAARAMEILERLDTKEARLLLDKLARGNPGARLTLDAVATLKRLRRKP